MINNKYTLFTIGQFASLHKINKKTLMWYDEVGLFHPAVVKDNGYRYYTHYQSSTLEAILILRELKVSIREIQDFMKHRSAESLEILLEEKIAELDQNIAHLKAIQKTMIRHKKDVSALLHIDLSEICMVEKEIQHFAIINTSKEISPEKEIGMILAETNKHQLHRLYDTTYGSMIPVDSLYNGDFEHYPYLFLEVFNPATTEHIHIKPKGMYLRAFCQGTWDKIPLKYEELLAYAKQHHLQLYGYAYETGINELTINSMDDYITQIEIQIKT